MWRPCSSIAHWFKGSYRTLLSGKLSIIIRIAPSFQHISAILCSLTGHVAGHQEPLSMPENNYLSQLARGGAQILTTVRSRLDLHSVQVSLPPQPNLLSNGSLKFVTFYLFPLYQAPWLFFLVHSPCFVSPWLSYAD